MENTCRVILNPLSKHFWRYSLPPCSTVPQFPCPQRCRKACIDDESLWEFLSSIQ
uniref:Uncharacterized protein n=1 Tax=Rhizophora mucronata TaxID=61149 RepID=A0A2P2NCJ5_RHIMU